MVLFFNTLNFTACSYCMFQVILPGYTACWMPAWKPVFQMHTGTDLFSRLSLPIGTLFSSVCMLLVVHSMFRLIEVVATIAVRMVTGSPIKLFSAENPVKKMSDAGTYARKRFKHTGKDLGTVVTRSRERSVAKEEQHKREDHNQGR